MKKLERCIPEEEALLNRMLQLCLTDKEGTRAEQDEIMRKLQELGDNAD
jgi:hypothetical protein